MNQTNIRLLAMAFTALFFVGCGEPGGEVQDAANAPAAEVKEAVDDAAAEVKEEEKKESQ